MLKEKGLKYLRDDLKTHQKYEQLKQRAQKLMPMILRTEDKNLIKKMTSSLRCYLPKAFFDTVRRIMKQNKTGK